MLSSTDAAAVFSVLRGVDVSRKLAGALELESGLNDAPVFIAVVLLAGNESLTLDARRCWRSTNSSVGALIGGVLGWLAAWVLRRAALPATGLYPLATVAVCVLAFAGRDLAHASGLLATYVCGLVLGNSHLPHRADTLSFAEGFGWLAQIGLFVLLGLYASPPKMLQAVVPGPGRRRRTGAAGPPAVGGAGLAAVPVAVAGSGFLSWSGLRGAVPIVLALIPLTDGRPGAQELVGAVFVLVVVLTLVQGGTLPMVASLLGLTGAVQPVELEVDSAPLDELDADLIQVRVQPGSQLHGVYLAELRLPDRRHGQPGGARRRRFHPQRQNPPAGGRPTPRRGHGTRSAKRRTPHPSGRPGRPLCPLEGRPGRLTPTIRTEWRRHRGLR